MNHEEMKTSLTAENIKSLLQRVPLVIWWLLLIFAVESISLATVFWPDARTYATVACGLVVLCVALFRPEIALAAIAAELAVGSKGALLKIPRGWEVDGGTSLRMILVGALMTGWAMNAIIWYVRRRDESPRTLKSIVTGKLAWLALAMLCCWAVVRGRHSPDWMKDANAWGFLIVLPVVLDVAYRHGERLMRHTIAALTAALIWLPIKTLGAMYVFSHGIKPLSHPLYLWIRRSGVGEVTLVTGNLFRIFIQSQVYALAGVLFGTAWLAERDHGKKSVMDYAVPVILVGSWISVLVSLSRSFWIGLAFGALTLIVIVLHAITKTHGGVFSRTSLRCSGRWMVSSLTAIVAAFAVILIVVRFPYPAFDVGSLSSLFAARGSATDAAAQSRWNLLPVLWNKIKTAPVLGSGFGATVTYPSQDPRILAQNPNGMYTTYAFEWGWLEHWIKFGVLGIPVMLWLLVSLIRRISRLTDSQSPAWIRVGFITSIVALSVLHFFTPYLNHPLGFGFLLLTEGYLETRKHFA